MGFQINQIDFNIRPKTFSFLFSFLLLANTSFVHGSFKTTSKIKIDLAVPPSRIFKATVYDFPTIAMIIMPQAFEKIDVINGNGGAGTIRIFHLPKGTSPVDTMTERVEAVDEKKLFYSVTMIQGPFPTGVKRILNDNKFRATANGTGTILTRKAYFYTTRDTRVNKTEIALVNERAVGIYKAFEAYLIANPNA